LALKNKRDMYKIWRSKQNSGFCGTRVQVGLYSGTRLPDEGCPNCGRRETADHLLLCSNEDRTQLLIENTDKLERWLGRDGITDLELPYWISPGYQYKPGRREPSLCSPNCNAVLHPLLVVYEDSSLVKLV
jgi:hypothetical protein